MRNRGWKIATVLLFAPTLLFLGAPDSGAEDAADGKALFEAQKCNMCHAVSSAGITAKTKSAAMQGPDLGGTEVEAAWFGQYLKKEVQKDGKDHKANFKGTDADIDALIKWLAAQPKAG